MITVKNFKGSSRWNKPSCSCESWIEHWKKNSNVSLNGTCRHCKNVVGNEELVGGHVQKVSSTDESLYIVPICNPCNSDDSEFRVNEEDLVSVTECKY